MTLVGIRDNLVAHLEAIWTHDDVPIYYENTEEIDIDNAGDFFLKCEIQMTAAKQINIAPNPDQRNYGTLVLTVFGRETLGTRKALGYLDELSDGFKFKNLSGVHLKEAEPGGDVKQKGWLSSELRIEFYADSNV